MVNRETNGHFRAPARLKLTFGEEVKAFTVIMEAIRSQEPKPADFRELAWSVAAFVVRSQQPKKRGRKLTWKLEDEFIVISMVEEELQKRGLISGDRKAVLNICADLKSRIPYFSRFSADRLRKIYYHARPGFEYLHFLLSEKSPEISDPKLVAAD